VDDFVKDSFPTGKKQGWKGRKKCQQELKRVQFVKANSLLWWFVITFPSTGRLNGSTRGMFKNTGWQNFLVCPVTHRNCGSNYRNCGAFRKFFFIIIPNDLLKRQEHYYDHCAYSGST